MARPSGHRLLLTGEVFRFLMTLRAADRQLLGRVFDSLVEHPFLVGDYQERDQDGRSMEVFLENVSC